MHPGMMPASYNMGGPPGLLPDAYGAYGSAPADMSVMGPGPGGAMPGPNMAPGMMGGGGGMDPSMMGGMGGCQYCGGAGCEACAGGAGGGFGDGRHGLLGDVFGLVAPYPDGGCAAVRWYDFSLDFMHLRREDAGRSVDIASLGLNGDIVLNSQDLDFGSESSFRFSAMFQFGPGSNLEFTYFGLFFFDDQTRITNQQNNLFSAFSGFGTLPFQGFDETDRSNVQAIDYESSFDSFEVNFRQRWMAPNCRYQGSWLAGFRYFKLDEDFNYETQSSFNGTLGNPARAQNNINVHNNMVGAQIGGDMWICILPGLRLGGEAKAGVFGNHVAIDNTISVNTGPDPLLEELSGNDVAFVGQADLMATYRLNYQWTLRAGYQFLFVEGVALAPENFNPDPPAIFSPAAGGSRSTIINDNGHVFYHGWSLGAEFMW